MFFRVRLAACLVLAALLFAPRTAQALVGIDCAMSEGTGYTNGQPTPITLVTVDGMAVELDTANAFLTMAQAAESDGSALHISPSRRVLDTAITRAGTRSISIPLLAESTTG